MNGQPSPNQGGIAQLAGGMGGMGGMGGSPTLGGAPQTPPMPQGGAQQPPQQAPQGGLPPDLLKALAAAKVKKMQDAAKRELELQMAQQQAASGEGNKTVVQQLQEGVEKEAMDETQQALTKKLSGGIQTVAQQSMQPQGQPMSGGIAAAPGANQAAQPEAMAAGGIVAFKEGDKVEGEDDQPVDAYNRASNETWLGQGIRRGKAAVKDVAGLLSLRPWATDPERVAKGDTRTNAEVEGYTPEGYKVNDRADQLKAAFDQQQAARPPAVTQDRPLPPTAGQNTADYEDMRGPQGGIPTALPRPPAQRPPVAAINQTPRLPAAAPNLNIQTNPNYAPPAAAGDAGGLSGLMAEQLKNRIGAKPEDAEAAAIKKYKDLMAVDPELAAQLKADTAAERAALQTRSTREPSVYDKLRAFADVAPAGGQTWTMAGAKGAGNINRLEKEYEADRMAALSGLKGLSKAEYDKQQGEKEKLYGVGTAANKAAQDSIDKAMTTAGQLINTQSVAEAARQQNISQEKVAKERNESQERIQRMHSAAMRDSRVIPVMEQMNTELKNATEAQKPAIVERYSQIANTLKPNQAAIRGESKLLGEALTYLRESNKDYRKATPEVKKQMEDDVLRRYGEGAPAAGSDGGVSKSAIDAEIARRGG